MLGQLMQRNSIAAAAILLCWVALAKQSEAALFSKSSSRSSIKVRTAVHDEEERLPGWGGETYKPQQQRQQGAPWIRQISWQPRAYVYHNFLSEAEARHIAAQAAPSMKRSTVVGAKGESVLDDYRTSFGTFLLRGHDKVTLSVQERVAKWTHVPPHHQEDMQVLRYANGQYYHAHMDSLDNDSPRMATVLIYLADPIVGGETAFPNSKHWSDKQLVNRLGPFSKCVKDHVAFRPRRGDALLFWSIKPDGKSEDPFSEHEGCPVEEGVKWTSTIWVHTVPFRPAEYNGTHFLRQGVETEAYSGECKDTHGECGKWAAAGECTKNPVFMVGNLDQVGSCAAACKQCEPCTPGDQACLDRNRQKAGFLVYDPQELNTPLTLQQKDIDRDAADAAEAAKAA